jgi:hypothetical protein
MKNLAAPASINFHETSKPLCMLETSTIHYHSEALILHTPARSFSFLFNNGATPGHSLSKNGDHKNQAVYEHVIHFPCVVLVNIRLS